MINGTKEAKGMAPLLFSKGVAKSMDLTTILLRFF